jgi:type I restriction enzyme S subunit
LGEIPEHWKVLPNIACFKERIERGFISDQLLSVTIDKGIIKQADLETKKDSSNEDKSHYKKVKNGDLAYNKMRMWQGAVGFSAFEGIVSPAYIVLNPDYMVSAKFFHYLFRTPVYTNESYRNSYGICDDQLSLRYKEFKRMYSIFPPPEEQDAIVSYLERKLEEIDQFISNKQNLISLLREQKTALISRAVTRGINPDVKLKHSGIDWLGDIPVHWELKRLKYVTNIQNGLTLGKSYSNQKTVNRPYLRVANVQDGYLDLTDITTIDLPEKEVGRYELRLGDVLMTEGGDFDKLGRGYVWEAQIEGCLHQNHIFCVRPYLNCLNSHFLALLMTSSHGKTYFTYTSKKTTNLASTNRTKLKDFQLPLPSIAEQNQILQFLSKQTSKIEQTISKAEREIELIKEYRTTLISDVVTGKVDVRDSSKKE